MTISKEPYSKKPGSSYEKEDVPSGQGVRGNEKAVRKVVAEHKMSGRPLVVWENGKVKKLYVK